jgi:hypothetical protein
MVRRAIWIVPLLVCSTWLLAAVSPVSEDGDDTDGPKFGPWSAPINIGPPVNTTSPDGQPFMTKDGLSLYFSVIEGVLATDPNHIWVAKRNSITDPWGSPEKLGFAINGGYNDNNAFVTLDGHWMYFSSQRSTPDANGVGPFGKNDIYVSHRLNKREDFGPSGWQEAVNLGSIINTSFSDRAPIIFEDDETGVTKLYFDSNRPGLGGNDIYASTLQPDGTFGPPTQIAELSTPFNDEHPMISRNGLVMYFISDRPGSTPARFGGYSRDIWVSTRASTLDPWGTPENLDVVNARLGGGPINSMFHEARPALSFDGTTLYFQVGGSPQNLGGQGNFDIWMTTRNKVKEQD